MTHHDEIAEREHQHAAQRHPQGMGADRIKSADALMVIYYGLVRAGPLPAKVLAAGRGNSQECRA